MIRRRLFNFAAASSLVLCAAVALVWTWSEGLSYDASWTLTRGIKLSMHDGEVAFFTANSAIFYETFSWRPMPPSETVGLAADWFQHWGIVFCRWNWPKYYPNGPVWTFRFSMIYPLLLSSALPLLWLILRHRRKLRILKGFCEMCSYNLTANTSGTCPECGTPVPSKSEGVA